MVFLFLLLILGIALWGALVTTGLHKKIGEKLLGFARHFEEDKKNK